MWGSTRQFLIYSTFVLVFNSPVVLLGAMKAFISARSFTIASASWLLPC